VKAIELQQWIEKELPNPVPEDGVDDIFAGDPQTEVRGVAITFLPNLFVLQEAARRGLNFVIGHEPVFYHHPWDYPKGDDYQTSMPADDLQEKMNTPPGKAKQQIIKEHDLVSYRLHDAWNDFPDRGMGVPFEKLLGWQGKRITQDAWIYEIPPTPLKDLAEDVAKKLGKRGIRLIGDPDRIVKRVSLDWGSPGAIGILTRGLKYGTDAAITGEVIEWRDVEFARDVGIALILGGHHATETPGMRYFYDWLVERRPDLRIEYIDAGDPDVFITL
jgi:putative NIF3 family GTP cyclohydrolase 1 type 2